MAGGVCVGLYYTTHYRTYSVLFPLHAWITDWLVSKRQRVCMEGVFLANVILTFTFAIICYRPSVCLSVTLVHPTQAVELFGNFFHHTIAQGLYISGAKNRWWGTPLSPEICVQSNPPPFRTTQFRPISAHSASTVIASEKSSISTYRKSTRQTDRRICDSI